MSDDAAVQESRFIREMMLHQMDVSEAGGRRFGLRADQICAGFRRSSHVSRSEAILERELRDLAQSGLCSEEWNSDLLVNLYTLTPRGRDFIRAGHPWDRLDEFSGKK